MKIALLLIPLLFFMTSCSIDWNDEKDKKIAELEEQISSMQSKNAIFLETYSKLSDANRELVFSGNISNIRLNECIISLDYVKKHQYKID